MSEAQYKIARDADGNRWMRVELVAALLRQVAGNVQRAPGGIILAEDLQQVLMSVADQVEKPT